MTPDFDVLIIGAGPGGCAAASILRRHGLSVVVVEKEIFPRFVIGESLLPSSMNLLQEAGLLEAVERQGFMRKYGAVFVGEKGTFNFDFSRQLADGWPYTYQVTRADFDQTLAEAVTAQGTPILFGHTVIAVDFTSSRARATIRRPDGGTCDLRAQFVLDCSGFGRVLPRLLQLETPSEFPPRQSLFCHVTGDQRPADREEGKIWICSHPGGAWIWVIPFSNGKTSVGAVGAPEFFASFPGDPEEQLRAIFMGESHVAARLAGAQFLFPPRRISNYSCAVKQLCGPRFALVGNATEFLDPIFSSGVTLALASANRAAQVLVRELQGEQPNWQTEYVDYVMQGMNAFRAYVQAWYDGSFLDIVFGARSDPQIMRQICSVLAGYVWDTSNPYARQPDRALPLLRKIVQRRAGAGRGDGVME